MSRTLSAIIGTVLLVLAVQTTLAEDAPPTLPTCESPLPTPLSGYDEAFFKLAAGSPDPALWVKYFASVGCPERRVVLQNLFCPIVKLPADAKLV